MLVDTSSPKLLCPYGIDHTYVQGLVEALVKKYRKRVGVSTTWSVRAHVCCPTSLPEVEAICWWDDEVWFAHMYVRCNLSLAMKEWLVAHELCELQTHREADWVLRLLSSTVIAPDQEIALRYEYKRLRNQGIEERLVGLFGKQRPDHLVQGEKVDTIFPLRRLEILRDEEIGEAIIKELS